MRFVSRSLLLTAAVLVGACQMNSTATGTGPVLTTLTPPQNLTYELDPSGTSGSPVGVLLAWDNDTSSNLAAFNVYSRPSTTANFGLRAQTTSNTFHDNGVPDLEYYVTALDVNGGESAPSNTITIDERLVLPAPTTLSSIALDSAIHLDWADNAFLAFPARFKWYRVYSTGFNAAGAVCDTSWVLEGTTVSHEFLSAQLTNGVARCYGVSAISVEGYESLWSPLVEDTPRPDARNVLVWSDAANAALAGFRFWNDANNNGYPDPGELGLVEASTRTDIDFLVHLQTTDSTLWIEPVFAGDSLQLYQGTPIADLTSIHTAPASGYARTLLQAQPGYGYVFERVVNGQVFYAGLRVSAVSRQYVIFDWSVQTAAGNPDLQIVRPPTPAGSVVRRVTSVRRIAGATGVR